MLFRDPDEPVVEEVVDPKAKDKKVAEKKPPLKKFKNDEEEKNYMDSFKERMCKKLTDSILDEMKFDDEDRAYNELFEYKKRRFVYDSAWFDKIERKKGIKDAEMEGKRICLKVHLKMNQAKYWEARFPKVEVVPDEAELAKLADPKAKGKDKKKDAGKPDVSVEKVYKTEERDVDMSTDFVDPESLEEIIRTVRT